ncbi:MAG: hypothetical protein R6W90_00445 [Ignavibacteriaceae bacterium]
MDVPALSFDKYLEQFFNPAAPVNPYTSITYPERVVYNIVKEKLKSNHNELLVRPPML